MKSIMDSTFGHEDLIITLGNMPPDIETSSIIEELCSENRKEWGKNVMAEAKRLVGTG